MTNIDKWPEAFDAQGIPKVGGKWACPGWTGCAVVAGVNGDRVQYEFPRGFDWLKSFHEPGPLTFLGFYDPPTQRAAAPQAALVLPRGWVLTDRMACVSVSVSGCYDKAVGGCEACGFAACSTHLAVATHHEKTCKHRISPVAPVAVPPPSMKAAVQQEGLSIPPQTTARHEVFEAAAQKWEGAKQFNLAGQNMKQARAALDADLAYDAEADAIRENRIVRKEALKEMGRGDRECFKLRNLRDFDAIKSDAHKEWLWWGTGEAPAAPQETVK